MQQHGVAVKRVATVINWFKNRYREQIGMSLIFELIYWLRIGVDTKQDN